jgi:hypothetical protein
MLKKIKELGKETLVVIGAAVLVAVVVLAITPHLVDTVDRHRFAGLWHVDGTMENWRFGSDGTFRNESLVSLEGSYSLLPHSRIDITTGWNGTTRYIYQFDGVGLSLTVEGQRSGYRLVRKD